MDDMIDKLRETVLGQDLSGDFPSWLLTDVLDIAGDPDRYSDKILLVETLITQIKEYDPYAGAGCFNTSVGADTIRYTIRQLQSDDTLRSCELLTCCQFFDNKMIDMPKTAEFIKNKVCHGDFESCARYRIFKEFGVDKLPFYLESDDTEEVKKAIQCLRNKKQSEE